MIGLGNVSKEQELASINNIRFEKPNRLKCWRYHFSKAIMSKMNKVNIINKDLSGFKNLIGLSGILDDLLYEAVYVPDGMEPFPRDIIKIPEINAYINGFGSQKDDHCLVAELNETIIGAVWVRILSGKIKGYGYVDDETPEFAISLFKEYRNLGIGTLLMQKMIEHLDEYGNAQTSLSVKKNH